MNMERAQLLRKVQIASFAVNEAVLYLDGHPTNKKALEFYEKWVKEAKELKDKYEKAYGPLTFYDGKGPSWTWIQGPWPWQTEREA